MAVSIKYGDELLTSVESGQGVTLHTENALMEKDLTVAVPAGVGETLAWEFIDNKPAFGRLSTKNEVTNTELSQDLKDLLTQLCEVARSYSNEKSRVFVGSRSQYNTANENGEVPIGTIVVITDFDVDQKTSAILGQAILGWLRLGQS